MKARIKTPYKSKDPFVPIAKLVEQKLDSMYIDDGELENIHSSVTSLQEMLAQLVATLFEQGNLSEEQLKSFIKIPYNGKIEYEQ